MLKVLLKRFSGHRFRGKVFIQSMMVSLLIVLGLSLFSYSLYRSVLQAEIIHKNEQLLNQNRTVFNTQHNWLIAYFFQIESNPSLSRIIYGKELSLLEMSRGLDVINDAFIYCPYLHSISIINKNDNILLNNREGLIKGEQVSASYLNVLDLVDKNGLYSYSLQSSNFPLYRFTDDDSRVLSFIFSRPADMSRRYSGFMVVNLDLNRLRELFIDSKDDESKDVIILDSAGQLISYPQDMAESELKYISSAFDGVAAQGGDSGSFFFPFGNSEKLITFNRAEDSGWVFLSVSDIDLLLAPVRKFWGGIKLGVFLFIILLIIIHLYLSRMLSANIENLFEHARKITETFGELPVPGNQSEVLYADEILKGMVEKTLSLNEYVKRQENYYTKELLTEFVLGHLCWDQLSADQKQLLNPWEKDEFHIIVLSLSQGEKSSSMFWDFVRDALLPQLPPPVMKLNLSNDHIVFITSAVQGRDSDRQRYEALLETILEKTEKFLTMGISGLLPGIGEFNRAYHEVMDLVPYQFRYERPSVLYSEGFVKPPNGLNSLKTARVSTFWLAMINGQYEKYSLLLKEFVAVLMRSSNDDFIYSRKLLYHVFNKHMKERGITPDSSVTACLQAVYSSTTVYTLHHNLEETLTCFRHKKSDLSGRDIKLADSVCLYIEDHLSEASLCPDYIADQFRLSKSTLRNLFKLVTGQNLSAYIAAKRLEKSKQLLLETSLTVREVANAVGINNYNYFFSCFRKDTGLTPRDFRMTHQLIS